MRVFLRDYGLAIASIIAVAFFFFVYNLVMHGSITNFKFWVTDKDNYEDILASGETPEGGQPYFTFEVEKGTDDDKYYVFKPKIISEDKEIDGEKVPQYEENVLVTRADLMRPVDLKVFSESGINKDDIELVVTAYEIRMSDGEGSIIPKIETDMVHVADKYGVLQYTRDGEPIKEKRVGYVYRANEDGVIVEPSYISDTDARVYGKVLTKEFDKDGEGYSFKSDRSVKLRVVYRYVDKTTGYKAEAMKLFTIKAAPIITTEEALDDLYDDFFNIAIRKKVDYTQPTKIDNDIEEVADYEGDTPEPPEITTYELDYEDSDKDKKDNNSESEPEDKDKNKKDENTEDIEDDEEDESDEEDTEEEDKGEGEESGEDVEETDTEESSDENPQPSDSNEKVNTENK